MKLEEGMYLKCTLQNNAGALLEAAVRLDMVDNRELVVLGFEKSKEKGLITRRFRINFDNVSRIKLKVGSDVWINGEQAIIIAHSKKITTKGHYVYWCKCKNRISVVSEDKMQVAFTDFEKDAEELFFSDNTSTIRDYLSRYEVNKYQDKLNAITSGYRGALDKKIDLYAHQIETVQKVLSGRPYRAILADEVGLGKTIEALVVLDYLLKKSVCKHAIIVVPDQLIYQWKSEAQERFGMDVSIFSYSKHVRGLDKTPVMLVGFSNFVRYGEEFILPREWGFAIIDEVHKSLSDSKVYSKLYKLCSKVQNHILLSATPIMKRNTEYYKLLKLLHPDIYSHIEIDKFIEIMQKKEVIESDLANIVSDIYYAFDDEALAEYIDRLKNFAENISDFNLRDYLADIDECTYDEQRKKIKRAILYLQKAYEIESKFIRHRRSDILDESSKRVLNKNLGFYLKGEDQLSGEENLYQCFTEELQQLNEGRNIDSEKLIILVNAFFSSATAFHKEIIENDWQQHFSNTSKQAYFESIKEHKTLSNSRIEVLVKNLKSYTGNEKIVIFSDLSESVSLIYQRLLKEFGSKKVVLFTGEDSEAKMQIAANNFMNTAAKFMICDRNGAEGRNFQFADVIIHYDMPWSPARLEQRIGRLDRIGRKPGKKVYNDVLYVKDTVEEDLFTLYNECLDIFDESLCGIEIIFDELWCAIKDAISERGLFGFSYVFDLVNELKEKCSQVLFDEMLDLECLEDDSSMSGNAKEIVELFTNEEKKKYYNAILKWHYDSGYGNKEAIEVDENCYRIPCENRDKKLAEKRKYNPQISKDILATYSLEKYENSNGIELLTNEHAIVKEVLKSMECTTAGVNLAIKVRSQNCDWRGFVITWKPKFYELDSMGKLWSSVNVAIKNDYMNHTRITIPYAIDSPVYLVEELFEIIKNGRVETLSAEEISKVLDYADVKLYLKEALNSTRERYIELLKNEIKYDVLEKKIELLNEENDVNQILGRVNAKSRMLLDIHEAVQKMMKNYEVEPESIMFVSVNKE